LIHNGYLILLAVRLQDLGYMLIPDNRGAECRLYYKNAKANISIKCR